MDSTKEPGIIFRGVYLTKLQFELSAIRPKEFHYGLSLSVDTKIDNKEDGGKILSLTLEADLMHDVKERPFTMQVQLLGVFDARPSSNLPIEEFAKVQAPALMVPYLREVVSSVTSRSGMPALVLPPINIHALLSRQKELSEANQGENAVVKR